MSNWAGTDDEQFVTERDNGETSTQYQLIVPAGLL
jgi:hypothetical protein